MGIDISRNIVEDIQNFIIQKKEECNISYNEVVREDVFQILQSQCTVLYYNLDDTVEGCHVFKPVNGELKQYVFINTGKNVQEQVWTAAHELGHVWKVDKYISEKYGDEYNDQKKAEQIVGRFAAEFLMPEKHFCKEIDSKLKLFDYTDSQMQERLMMELIAYLMNFFCTPYKSVVLRFIELGYVSKTEYENYMRFEDGEVLHQIIKENHYSRLFKEQSAYTIENFAKELQEVEDKGLMNEKKIKKIRERFHMEKQQPLGEKLEFKGTKESK